MNYYLNKIAQIVDPGDINLPQTPVNDTTIPNILQLVFGIFAAVAVLIITLAALKLVLSRGNPQETAKAREAIIYAAVGLAISLSAFTIVAFVVEAI